MPESDYTKQVVGDAIQDATHVQQMLETSVDSALSDVLTNINVMRKSIEVAQRKILAIIPDLRNSKAAAQSVVGGTTGTVAEAIAMLEVSDEDLVNVVRNLEQTKIELNELQATVRSSFEMSTKTVMGRLKNAIIFLRQYWQIL